MSRDKHSIKAVWLIHALCLALMLGTVYTAFRYSSHEYFRDAIHRHAYDETEIFHEQFTKDIRNAAKYLRLEQKFETEGMLNLDKVIQYGTRDDGSIIAYTLQMALDYGRSVGVTFDEDKHLVVGRNNTLEEDQGEVDEEKIEQAKQQREEMENAFRNGDFDATFSAGSSDDNPPSEKTVYLSLLYQLSEYYELQKYLGGRGVQQMNFCYRFIFTNAAGDTVVSTNADSSLTSGKLESYGRYFSITSESGRFRSNLPDAVNNEIFYELQYNEMLSGGTYEILAAVDTAFPVKDPYQRGYERYHQFVRLIELLLTLFCLLFAGLLVSFAALAVMGRQELRGIDLWYSEISLLGTFLMGYVIYWTIHQTRYGFSTGYYLDVLSGEILFALAYFPTLLGILSIIRRVRKRQFLSRFLTYQVVRVMRDNLREHGGKYRTGIQMLLFALYQLLILLLAAGGAAAWVKRYFPAGALLLTAAVLLDAWYVLRICYRGRQQKKILERLERLAEGDVGRRMELTGMSGDMRWLAETVNSLDESLEKAVQERTRSERMKTDLIANVSHDLRTPLTSIINYVDLLKRENFPDPKVQDYLRVLEEKAARLKTMAEALMDASRASSGNMTISWERIDMVQMLSQVYGEFQEKMEAANLEPVIHLIEPPAMILADGRILWRVLDNLYTNTCKYAQPGTRVYIDLQETAHSLIYTMKNVSASPLNIPAEELTERFIRGDVARSSEGSGLGLSIAKSMTEQLHGKFELFLDGDFFRVRLVFPLAEENNY